jgi:hypothetical protein
MAVESRRPWRERKRWRDAGCDGEADPLFLPGWTLGTEEWVVVVRLETR